MGPLTDIVLHPLVNPQPIPGNPCQSLTILVESRNPLCLASGHLHTPSGFNPQPSDFVSEPRDFTPNLLDIRIHLRDSIPTLGTFGSALQDVALPELWLL